MYLLVFFLMLIWLIAGILLTVINVFIPVLLSDKIPFFRKYEGIGTNVIFVIIFIINVYIGIYFLDIIESVIEGR